MLSCNKSSKLSPSSSRSGRLSPSAPRPPSELLITTCTDTVGHGNRVEVKSDGWQSDGDEPEVHSLSSVREHIAACFAAAQQSLAESHERALGLLSKCADDAAQRNSEVKSSRCPSPSNGSSCQASLKPGHEREGLAPAGFQHNANRLSLISVGPVASIASNNSDTILISDLVSGREVLSQDTHERTLERPLHPQASPRANSLALSDAPLLPMQLQAHSGSRSAAMEVDESDSDEEQMARQREVCHSPSIMVYSSCAEAGNGRRADMQMQRVASDGRADMQMQRTVSEGSRVRLKPSELRTPSLVPESGDSVAAQEALPVSPTASARVRRLSWASGVSLDANQHFDLLPVWSRWTLSMRSRKKISAIRKLTLDLSSEDLEDIEPEKKSWRGKATAMHPASVKRAAWDVGRMILVLYDLVVIPLFFCDIAERDFIVAMQWFTRMFWAFDIGVSFLTGFLNYDGTVETSLSVIARRYLRTYFAMDLAIVGVDWFEVFVDDYSHVGTAPLSIRILRLVRLLRLARIINVFMLISERIENEQMVIVAGIVRIMLLIMGLGHIIACLWYGLATMDRPDTWMKVHNFEDSSLDYKYTTSLHWALLQFAGGTDEVVPQNTWERVYSIFVFLVAFVVAAVFLGRLTSSMTKLHMLASKDFEKLHVLRRYLQKNRISGRLARRVQHNAHHALFERQRFMEESTVELLEVISDSLRAELHFELYAPVLAVHPFFCAYIEACRQVIQRLCHAGMSQLLVSAGDVVFMLGEVPVQPRMLIVCSGRLTYHYASGAVMYVEPGQWISEAVLWTSWVYRGMLTAASDCRLCVLNAAKFQELADTLDHPDFDLKKYAQAFVDSMNSGLMECSDLPFGENCRTVLEAIEGMSRHLDTAKYCHVDQTPTDTDTVGMWSRGIKHVSSRSRMNDRRVRDMSIVPSPRKSVLMTPL